MQITVHSYFALDPSLKNCHLNIPPFTKVKTVIKMINVPAERLIVVNGVVVDLNHILEEGDELHIFPIVSGG